jgi:ubiquinone biosynthesis protein COQ4
MHHIRTCFAFREKLLARRRFGNLSSENTIPFYGAPRRQLNMPTETPSGDCSLKSNIPAALEKLWLTTRFALIAARDPTRADAVAAVGELTGEHALQRLLRSMQADPVGRIILAEKPIVSKATIPYEKLLESAVDENDPLQKGVTFGQAYGWFLKSHGFDPDERDTVKYVSDPDLAYVITRYRQCHDFWHALTGLPPTVPGELGLKWLELFITGLPVTALSVSFGSLFTLSAKERHIVMDIYLPWARKQRMAPGALLSVYYEKEWDTPLNDLRKRLRLEPAPRVPLNH